jgi:hypothetical protein
MCHQTYVYMYIFKDIYIYIDVYKNISIYRYIDTYAYTYMYVYYYMYTNIHIFIYTGNKASDLYTYVLKLLIYIHVF